MTDRDAGASRSDADKRIDERFDLSPACSADERFLSCGASCKLRTDVAKYLNAPSAQHAGFDFSFPIAATNSVKENYRLFVLSRITKKFFHLNYNSMHGLVASAFLSVVLLGAAALAGDRLGQASAGESDEVPPVESTQPRPAAPSSSAASVAGICDALAAAAAKNDLPPDFFARLIWQESRFDPSAVSRAGAQGVAQFMPATASARGLADPFDPMEAIAHSAKLLRDLRREFGNLGLAAAAYNAGSGRVRDWLAGRRGLPRETDAYVKIITGQPPEQWAKVHAGPAETHVAHAVPCAQIADLAAHAPALVMKPLDPWGVQLVGSSSDTTALAAYRRLQERYASILGSREPRVLHHGLARGSMGWARVHVGAESHAGAEKLCAALRAAGGSCTVQRN